MYYVSKRVCLFERLIFLKISFVLQGAAQLFQLKIFFFENKIMFTLIFQAENNSDINGSDKKFLRYGAELKEHITNHKKIKIMYHT